MDIPQWIKDLPPIAVAWAGVAVGTASALISATSLFVHWRNYRRDNYVVEVELQWNAFAVHEHGMRSPIKHRFGHITVTNKGRRPVHITYIGLQLPGHASTSASWIDDTVKLDEGDASIVIKIPQDSVLEPFLGEWEKIYAKVGTTAGRWYRSQRGTERPIILPGFDLQSAGRLQDFTLLTPKDSTLGVIVKPPRWTEKIAPEIEVDRRR